MVLAVIQPTELLCDGAKSFLINSTKSPGLSYQTTYTCACNVFGFTCQAFGSSML